MISGSIVKFRKRKKKKHPSNWSNKGLHWMPEDEVGHTSGHDTTRRTKTSRKDDWLGRKQRTEPPTANGSEWRLDWMESHYPLTLFWLVRRTQSRRILIIYIFNSENCGICLVLFRASFNNLWRWIGAIRNKLIIIIITTRGWHKIMSPMQRSVINK